MPDTARQHKQMPDAAKMRYLFIKYINNHPEGKNIPPDRSQNNPVEVRCCNRGLNATVTLVLRWRLVSMIFCQVL